MTPTKLDKEEAKAWLDIAERIRLLEYICINIARYAPLHLKTRMIDRLWGGRKPLLLPVEWCNPDDGRVYVMQRELYCIFMALECDPNCLN